MINKKLGAHTLVLGVIYEEWAGECDQVEPYAIRVRLRLYGMRRAQGHGVPSRSVAANPMGAEMHQGVLKFTPFYCWEGPSAKRAYSL